LPIEEKTPEVNTAKVNTEVKTAEAKPADDKMTAKQDSTVAVPVPAANIPVSTPQPDNGGSH
jgi:hypothetical protein